MIKRMIESLVSGFVLSLILKALDKYGGVRIMKEIFQTFVIELWPWWIGIMFVLIYLFISFQYHLYKSIKKIDGFDHRLSELKENIDGHYQTHGSITQK